MRVAVVGAGVTGLASTDALLARGVSVTCFERGPVMGERSAGESRIFRFAHRDPVLVEAARRSREHFRAWEARAGQRLIEPVGTVVSGPHLREWKDAMVAAGAEVAEGGFRLPTGRRPEEAVVDPAGGVIRVDRVGDLLRTSVSPKDAYVYALEDVPGGVVVHSSAGSERFDTVLLAAGAGNAALGAQVGLYPPVALSHHTRFTFRLRHSAPSQPQCWITTSAGGMHTYQHSGTAGHWAVGVELSEQQTRWEVGRTAATAAAEEATVAYVKAELEHAETEVVGRLYCTTNPELDDGIHYLRSGRVLCVYGENLFKFAPLIGQDCADALIDGSVPLLLGPDHPSGA